MKKIFAVLFFSFALFFTCVAYIPAAVEKAARKGDADAQYKAGRHCEKDEREREAFLWYEKAAKKMHLKAIKRLAWCYKKGYGVKQNLTVAEELYALADKFEAAKKGDIAAQFWLGEYYERKGESSFAAAWFRLAAKQGYADAQYALGLIYLNRAYVNASRVHGMPDLAGMRNSMLAEQNLEEAVFWLCEAAKQGHKKAIDALRRLQ